MSNSTEKNTNNAKTKNADDKHDQAVSDTKEDKSNGNSTKSKDGKDYF